LTVTRAEYEGLKARKGRRAQQPPKEPGDLLAIFCPGILKNPLNGPQYGRQKFAHAGYRKRWKERVSLAVWEANWEPSHVVPKAVTFHANVFNLFDTDGLQAACKPLRDALVECGVISGDAERDGHSFTYTQRIDRKARGVEIRVRQRTSA
jgi:hypothetical protein